MNKNFLGAHRICLLASRLPPAHAHLQNTVSLKNPSPPFSLCPLPGGGGGLETRLQATLLLPLLFLLTSVPSHHWVPPFSAICYTLGKLIPALSRKTPNLGVLGRGALRTSTLTQSEPQRSSPHPWPLPSRVIQRLPWGQYQLPIPGAGGGGGGSQPRAWSVWGNRLDPHQPSVSF